MRTGMREVNGFCFTARHTSKPDMCGISRSRIRRSGSRSCTDFSAAAPSGASPTLWPDASSSARTILRMLSLSSANSR